MRIGVFVVPAADDPAATVERIVAAERAGLDVAGVQDHPYQRRFLDTWTLLAFAAARTERVTLLPDVANLPLRPAAMLAKAATSLDVLSGGRVELGLGAGAFWDGIAAMGGPRLTPKESVDALEAAIPVMRSFWFEPGKYHGPPPAHRIGIWIGAYRPRMLRLTGRLADGWLPSLSPGYLPDDAVPELHATIDEAARRAGRDPAAVERGVNVMTLEGGPDAWVDRLSRVVELGFTTLIVALPDDDPLGFIRRLGEDVAPRIRERGR